MISKIKIFCLYDLTKSMLHNTIFAKHTKYFKQLVFWNKLIKMYFPLSSFKKHFYTLYEYDVIIFIDLRYNMYFYIESKKSLNII